MLKSLIVDPKIRSIKPGELVEQPHIIRVRKFDEDGARDFSDQMVAAHNTGQPVIPIVIDSFGGECYSLLDMIAQIQQAKLPIATILEGKAMSCGAMLFAMGTTGYRYMSKHATLMLHDVSSGFWGKILDVKADADEAMRLQKLIFKLIARNCEHPDDYFTKLIHKRGHADWFLTAKDSKRHKLTNHIGIPEFRTEISVSHEFIFTNPQN